MHIIASHLLRLVPLVLAAAVSSAGGAQPLPLPRAHAHNDYWHARPLLDALAHGFCSVEADVLLMDGKLLVGHGRKEVRPDRTLESLYLAPLAARVEANGGRVYRGGPCFTLLVDLKTDGRAAWPVLDRLLARYERMLTVSRSGEVRPGAVEVVVSGKCPRSSIERATVRRAAIDGRTPDLDDDSPAHLVPLVSDRWSKHFRWNGTGAMPANEKKKLAAFVSKAHRAGRRVRFWATPDREPMWRALRDAGVDLINTDDLPGLARFLRDQDEPAPAVGPIVGHTTDREVTIWYRPPGPGRLVLTVRPAAGGAPRRATARAVRDRDLCTTWRVAGLAPGTRYRYEISGVSSAKSPRQTFTTGPAVGEPARVRIGFGSCASSEPSSVWSRIGAEGVDGFVLLGDTPYIDTTKLPVVRKKHRRFLRVPELAALFRSTPMWATWDDHDFGRNDSDGTLPGKAQARRGFVEYRANASFGERGAGIYTRFRYGPLEVFLLDARWFARTERSPVDKAKQTLLGRAQWRWLQRKLAASTAPFKVLATGMIWDDKKNRESDDWHTYRHERDALFRFLGEKRVGGVVLVGGDIHVSRALRYPKTTEVVGYALHQFIVSPLSDRVIESLNVPHPALVHDAVEPRVFLVLTADTTCEPARLKATWINATGKRLFDVTLTADDLTPRT